MSRIRLAASDGPAVTERPTTRQSLKICLAAMLLSQPVHTLGEPTGALLDDAIAEETRALSQAREKERRLRDVASSTTDMRSRYRAVIEEQEQLRAYEQQLATALENQVKQLDDLRRQHRELQVTEREIEPLLARMLTSLEELAHLPGPIKRIELETTVQTLKSQVNDSNLGLAQRYRKILEAYLDELRYGRELALSTETIKVNGESRMVQVIRAGRVAAIYRSLDGKEYGAWNQPSLSWEPLPEAVAKHTGKLIAVAEGRARSDFVILPVVTGGTPK